MNKELIKLLKDLNKHLNMLGVATSDNTMKKINEAFEQEASISIKKHKDGTANTKIEGSNIGILITLVGLEKSILEKINPPKEFWNLLKETVGVKDYE